LAKLDNGVNYKIDFISKNDIVHVDNLKKFNLRNNAQHKERLTTNRAGLGEFYRVIDFESGEANDDANHL